jgi:hypothetical protein
MFASKYIIMKREEKRGVSVGFWLLPTDSADKLQLIGFSPMAVLIRIMYV